MSSPLASTAAHDAFRKTTPSEISACAIRGGVWNALRSYLEAFTADGQSAGEHRRIGTGASAHSRAADQSPFDVLLTRFDHESTMLPGSSHRSWKNLRLFSWKPQRWQSVRLRQLSIGSRWNIHLTSLHHSALSKSIARKAQVSSANSG
jgi:hypothetical protein